jgi:rRNA maturation protein Nop10
MELRLASRREKTLNLIGPAPRYRAWMLRCWEVAGDASIGPMPWQFSLEDPHTRERRGFASMESLVAFLLDELASGRDLPDGTAS